MRHDAFRIEGSDPEEAEPMSFFCPKKSRKNRLEFSLLLGKLSSAWSGFARLFSRALAHQFPVVLDASKNRIPISERSHENRGEPKVELPPKTRKTCGRARRAACFSPPLGRSRGREPVRDAGGTPARQRATGWVGGAGGPGGRRCPPARGCRGGRAPPPCFG